MICLNKADQASCKHLTWNQSPSTLAADKTTRQDLNGIANLREYVAAGQVHTGGSSAVTTGSAARLGCISPSDNNGIRPAVTPGPAAESPPVAPWFIRLSSHLRSVAGRHGCLGLVPLSSSSRRAADGLWSWTSWIASLLLCSYLLSSLPSLGQGLWGTNYGAIAAVSSFVPRHAPTRLHASPARLVRRAATCKAGGVDPGVYDTPLHAGALLIIWFISTIGCSFPIMAAKIPSLRIPRRFFFAIRHFGTGVLIATAFVHLLPTAFISLGNPCLGSFWTTKYQAMPGAIALAAIFLVSVIEMVLHPSRHVRSSTIVSATPATGQLAPPIGHHLCSGATMLPFRDMGSLSGRSSSLGHGLTQLSQSPVVDGDPETSRRSAPSADERTKPEPESYQDHDDGSGDSCQEPRPTPEMKRRKERLQCILLEMGILFHSVFIGMALSVSVGSDFVVLLIAIIFHQTFEGLALGARIAAIEWESKKRWQPWAMALAYGCTTPIGQAIGLATHTLYSPDSEVGLVLVGVMNAISAGLLTFASLVELLSEDFLSDESFRHLHGKQRVIACLLVFFGAFFMSLIGAWA